jgi:1,4-alpha-glucan branching enzyme/maltooligosyltrehalose trehalohydrolase
MLYEPSKRREGGARVDPREAPPQPLGALVNFVQNHDQTGNRAFGERLRQLVPPGAAPLATLLALLTPAIPMLFFGEEFGSATPFLYFADWEGDLRDAVRAGRQREFGHVAGSRALPDPCAASTFEATRPDESQRDSEEGRRWLDMVAQALHVRRLHIAPRHAQLAHGQHTAHRVGETGIQVCWRYDDGQAIVLQLNLGPVPQHVSETLTEITQPRELFSHARPAGTPEGTWPAWSARWWMGTQA